MLYQDIVLFNSARGASFLRTLNDLEVDAVVLRTVKTVSLGDRGNVTRQAASGWAAEVLAALDIRQVNTVDIRGLKLSAKSFWSLRSE